MDSLISIVIPVYNAAAYLNRCVKSVVEQTYHHLEIILVDDGSKDNSLQICKEWGEKDDRIQVIGQINKGVSSARNSGIKNATGDYLLLLDSDDWLATDTCENLLRYSELQNADCVVYGIRQTSGNIWAPKYDRFYDDRSAFKNDFIYWLDTEILSSSVNKIYKRSKIKTLFPEEMSYGEDLVFVLSYLSHCERISFITESYYQHEVYNSASLTHTFTPDRFSDLENIQRSILAFADDDGKREKHIFDKYVRDSIRMIRMCYKSNNLSLAEKNDTISKWIKGSYIKCLNNNNFNLSWKERLILFCAQNSIYAGINFIVNGKTYIKNILKTN